MKKIIISEEEKKRILNLHESRSKSFYLINESDEPQTELEIKDFQNWVIFVKKDRKILGPTGADGDWGGNSQNAWEKYGNEYLKEKKESDENPPYEKLKLNPSPEFIADTIKKSYGGLFGNDKEAWAQAAFAAIKNKKNYEEVKKFLGEDPYEYLKSFINTKETKHTGPTIDEKYQQLFPEKSVDSCSPESIKVLNWSQLYRILVNKQMITDGEPLLIIWGPTQNLYYTKDGKSSSLTAKVSTGANGFSNNEDNKQTSTGLLKINGKIIGDDYEVLVGKTPTGKILGPNTPSNRVDDKGNKHIAEVLTAILELTGLEECNSNTFSRYIYIHGTNRESFLGTPKSNGCIRVSNNIIKKLVNLLPTGTKVYVYPD